MADDLAAVDVCLQLTVTQLLGVARPLEGVGLGRKLDPVAPNHVMVNHETQSEQHIAFICCEAAGLVHGLYVDALLKDACTHW